MIKAVRRQLTTRCAAPCTPRGRSSSQDIRLQIGTIVLPTAYVDTFGDVVVVW